MEKSADVTLVVSTKVKEAIKGLNDEMRIGGDFIAALSEKTYDIIREALARAEANGRKTLKPADL